MNAWLMAVAIVVCAFGLYWVCVMLQRRHVPTWVRHPLRAGSRMHPRTILVTGATGFIGRHWCRRVIEAGDRLIVLTRCAARARDLFGPHAHVVTSLAEIESAARIDAIVNLAGAPIMGAHWTKRRRAVLFDSRLRITNALVELCARLAHKPRAFVSMSAIGYYGVRDAEEVTEADRGRPIFQSHLCQAWELAAQRATQLGVRVCRLRAGLVLGTDGGALPQLARSARLRFAVILGSGAQWLSWIHIDDLVRLIARSIDDPEWRGAFNATAPEPLPQAEFARTLAARFGRSLTVAIPDRVLRMALGEMAQLLADGQRVVPVRARSAGFKFGFPTLAAAVSSLYPSPSRAGLRGPAQILYDPVCPVCSMEMRRYCEAAQREELPWTFADGAASPQIMAQCGIDADTARRRVYVVDARGHLASGIDALTLIWASLPRWRFVARIVSWPVVRQAANLLYDLLLAPAIWRWSTRRRARGVTAAAVTHS